MNSFYYESSNRTDFKTLLPLSLIVILIIPILAYIYANVTWFIPIIYVNFLLTIGLGIGVGYLTELLLWYGKCRNSTHAIIISIIIGIFTVYCQWAVWLQVVSSIDQGYTSMQKYELIFAYFSNPLIMGEMMSLVAETGVWEIGGGTVSGIFLWIVWLIEAGIILFVIIGRTGKFVNEPFCEDSNSWATRYNLRALTSIPNPNDIKVELANKNYTVLESLERADEMKAHGALTFYHCEMKDDYYLTINNKIVFIGKEEVKMIDNFLVENIKVDNHIAKQLIEKYGQKESLVNHLKNF